MTDYKYYSYLKLMSTNGLGHICQTFLWQSCEIANNNNNNKQLQNENKNK